MARRVPVKTALVGLLFAPGAMAQQPPDQNAQAPDPTLPPNENKPADPNAAPATMQPVTVTGSRPSDDFQVTRGSLNRMGAAELMDVPQTVVVINRALMQSQGATTMENALRNVPGVTIGSAEGGTIGTNINLNGFSARTDIYLDGMRDRGQYYRDVFALEQIEVLMGPSSMLFGRGSTGGVINQVTKKPFLKNATELSVQATTNGLVRSTADVNVPFGQDSTNAARVSAMFQVGKASTLDQTNVLDFGFAPSVKLGIGTPTEITLSAILQHRKDQVPYGVPNLNGFPINVPRNTAYGYDSDATVQDVITAEQHDRSQVRHQPQPAQPDGIRLGQHRGAGDLGRLRRHARRERRLRAGGRRSGQHAVQRRAAEPALRSPAQPRSKHQRLHAREPDRGDGQVRHRLRRPYAADGRRPQLRGLHQQDLYPYRHLQRHPAGGGLSRLRAPRASRPAATRRRTFPACRATMRRRRPGASACMPTIPPRFCPG